jgi:hypothetical protein
VFIYKRTSASPRGVSLGEKLSHLMEGIEHTYCNTYVRMCSVRACVTWLVLLCLFCLSGVTTEPGKRISASWSDRSQDFLVGFGGRRYGRRVNERGVPRQVRLTRCQEEEEVKNNGVCLSMQGSVDGEVLLAHRPGI